MQVDEYKFFRQATLLICGSLDIEKALSRFHQYLKNFMPVVSVHLSLLEPDLSAVRLIAQSSFGRDLKIGSMLPFSQEAQGRLKEELAKWPGVIIVNRPEIHPIAQNVIGWFGLTDMSFMAMHLEIEGKKIGVLGCQTEGKDKYNESHAHLLSMLHEPFAIAMSNVLRYQELLRLKDTQDDHIQYLNQTLLRFSGDEIIGADFGLRSVMENVRHVAPVNTPVLLLGETGVGKEVIANAIQRSSQRNNGPFIKVNCGAIPEALMDSELFGHEKGSFTGASQTKHGLFELAHHGTIFLDEIGELPLLAQARLLRVIENQEIRRVGGGKSRFVDIRIIAATQRDLEKMVAANEFRNDLWFRLNVFPITIPPLRERKEDIHALARHFLERKSKEMNLYAIPSFAPEAIDMLKSYHWPGNVRELENMIERILIEYRRDGKHKSLRIQGFLSPQVKKESNQVGLTDQDNEFLSLDKATSIYIQRALKLAQGKIAGPGGAAELLQIPPSTLRAKMEKLGILYKRRKNNDG